MADASLKIIISALNTASKELTKLKSEIDGVDSAGKTADSSTAGLTDKFKSLMKTGGEVALVVSTVTLALKQVYQAAEEGAELEYAETRFKNLAESIGTTADVLKEDMREATRGMISDSDLVASGADLMALGLAKDHDAVVRLASVAGALNMNMNQLVLTLTNQTTMRFDALGVSVDGFEARVASLKASGMSANEAFSEAFLQQAEEQIARVGEVADSSAGSFRSLKTSVKNFSDAAKKDLSDALAPAVQDLADLLSSMEKQMTRSQGFRELSEQLEAAGVNVYEFGQRYTENLNFLGWTEDVDAYNALLDEMRAKLETATGGTETWASANYDTGASFSAITEGATEAALATAELKTKLDDLKSLGENFGGIISYAKKYDEIQGEIAKNEARIAELTGDTTESGVAERDKLIAKNGELKQSMTDMANQVTLDMFKATIEIGGVTDAEIQAYFDMAEEMGLISEEAAVAAIDAYGNASRTISGMDFDAEGNVKLDPSEALATIKMIEAIKIADLNGNINMTVRYYGTGGGNYDPYEPGSGYTPPGGATGGEIAHGGLITVGELGPELVYLPASARIIPHGRVEETVRGLSNTSNHSEVVNNYYYNLTMPTSSNPADIKTAFELMEALNQ